MRKLAPYLLALLACGAASAAEFSRSDWVRQDPLRFPDGAFDPTNPDLDLLLNRSHSAVLGSI